MAKKSHKKLGVKVGAIASTATALLECTGATHRCDANTSETQIQSQASVGGERRHKKAKRCLRKKRTSTQASNSNDATTPEHLAPDSVKTNTSTATRHIASSRKRCLEAVQCRSKLLCTVQSADQEELVARLRRGRVGGEALVKQPTPEAEKVRAAALEQLRRHFFSLIQTHGTYKNLTGSFEKWHFLWMHQAEAHALAAGRLAPMEPLLPRMPGGAQDRLELLEGMLQKDLVGKGLQAAAAASIAEDIRTATVAAAAKLRAMLRKQKPSMELVKVVTTADGDGRALSVQHGSTKLRLNRTRYDKLRRLFIGELSDEQAFHRALFCLLLRYKALLGGGTQAAIGGEVFAALQESFDVRFECFASPLNCWHHNFCSAFPDTDEVFGSIGSFFALAPNSGSYELNPPFIDTLIQAMVVRIQELLSRAEGDGNSLTFVIIVGANGVIRQKKMWQSLQASCFFRAHLLVKSTDHGYYEGEQHISKEAIRLSPCDTGVFVWQTARAYELVPASTSTMRCVLDGFHASRPGHVRKHKRCKKRAA